MFDFVCVSPVRKARVLERSSMRIFRAWSLISVAAFALASGPSWAQELQLPKTAVDAALDMANSLDGAGGGISSDALISALESAAEAGQPMALWQLGTMYENGEGVTKDPVKAFGYFSQIANQHADTPPRGVEADIVAQSFVKVGDYYRDGLPDAGIKANADRSHAMLIHAASYFGDADAQYRVGLLYLQENELGVNPLQSARWFSLAARKGHGPAQAALGEMLFDGIEGFEAQPVEGLMWLTMAKNRVLGTQDESWVVEKFDRALSRATVEQQAEATQLADQLAPQFNGF
jgi:TPR repeat protein